MNDQHHDHFHRNDDLADVHSPGSSVEYTGHEDSSLPFGERDQQPTLRSDLARVNSSETISGSDSRRSDVGADETRNTSAAAKNPSSIKADTDTDKADIDPKVDVRGCDSETVSDTKASTVNDAPRLWTPYFLRTPPLLCFALAYTALLVSLIVLGIVDGKNKGLTTSDTSRHYLWTYGPTAIISIVAAFWSQVEYRTKQMMPWEILHRGPSSATDTLLMDYTDPPRIVALFSSLKHAHYPVSLATAGTLLLQLLTVISTGLMMLQTERMKHPEVGLVSSDDFGIDPTGRVASESTPMLSAIALNQGNLSYPPGTSEKLAFPSFSIENDLKDAQNVSIETTADIFHATLGCEVFSDARWSDECLVPGGECKTTQAMISFDTPSCRVENRSIGTLSVDSAPGIFGLTAPAYCGDSSTDFRFVIAMATYSMEVDSDNATGPLTSRGLIVEDSTVLMCKPQYTIAPGTLLIDDTGALLANGSLPPLSTESTRLVTSQKTFLDTFIRSAGFADFAIPGDRDWYFYDRFMDHRDEFFTVLAAFVDPEDMTGLFPPDVLLTESERFYSMASAQLAKEHLMTSTSAKATGTVFSDDQRLRIRGLSLYLMDAILALLIIITIALCFVAPRNNTSHDTGSVGGLALTLAESPSLRESLSGQGTTDTPGLKSLLAGYRALSVLKVHEGRPEFRIVLFPNDSADTSGPSTPTEDSPRKRKIHWWQPLSMSPVTKICVIVFLLLLVAALESLYQASKGHDGLANVGTDGYVHYTWSYIPALTMFTAALLVTTIGDSTKTIFPYHELRRKLNFTTQQLFSNHLTKVTVHSIYSSVVSREFAILATGLSMLLTPFLTIVASGLYSPEMTRASQDVTLGYVNTFNLSELPRIQTESSYALSLILRSNLSYPAWTHGEFAFPEVTLDTIKNTGEDISSTYHTLNDSSVQLAVPAIRASLPCTPFAPGTVRTEQIPQIPAWTAETPDGGECSLLTSEHMFNDSLPFGWSDWVACPSHPHAVYGPALDNNSAQGIACTPSIQQVMVDLTLALPDLAIHAVAPHEDTATDFDAADWNWSNFDLNRILPIGPYANGSAADLDATFQSLLHAANVSTPGALPPVATLAAHLEHIFRLAFAQVATLHFRAPAAPDAPKLDGTLVSPRLRLKQNAASTRVLEALLLAIAVCVGASAFLLDARKVLPKNPCSIAAAASLVVDAEMLRVVPPGAVWEVGRREVFGGKEGFSMGWWGEGGKEGGRRRFGIDRGRAGWE